MGYGAPSVVGCWCFGLCFFCAGPGPIFERRSFQIRQMAPIVGNSACRKNIVCAIRFPRGSCTSEVGTIGDARGADGATSTRPTCKRAGRNSWAQRHPAFLLLPPAIRESPRMCSNASCMTSSPAPSPSLSTARSAASPRASPCSFASLSGVAWPNSGTSKRTEF